MSYRIKIEFPNEFVFKTYYPLSITDINYGGHLGNDKVLSIAHEARVRFLAQWNMTEMNAGGTSLIMADSAVQYKGEAFYGDSLLVEICVGEISKKGFELFYKLSTHRKNEQVNIAFVKTGLLCFDYNSRKIVDMNHDLATKLNSIKN